MMHKAWSSIEEVPYFFWRSSVKFQGPTGWKIDDWNPIWVRLLGRSQLSNPSDLPCSFKESPGFHGTVIQHIGGWMQEMHNRIAFSHKYILWSITHLYWYSKGVIYFCQTWHPKHYCIQPPNINWIINRTWWAQQSNNSQYLWCSESVTCMPKQSK